MMLGPVKQLLFLSYLYHFLTFKMPKKQNPVGRDDGVLKAPKGGGYALNVIEGRNAEYHADDAEKEGLTVFRGASIILREVDPNLFAAKITVGVLVPRDHTFAEFVPHAINRISGTLQKLRIVKDISEMEFKFFIGEKNITPNNDTSIMDLEQEYMDQDGFIRMKLTTK